MSFFLALELSPTVNNEVSTLVSKLREVPAYEGKWVKPERLHLTLVFMGQRSSEEIESIRERAQKVCGTIPRFNLHLQGAGTFVTERAPCVLWLGVARQIDALHSLQLNLSTLFWPNEKEFVPHVTLARGKSTNQYAVLALELATWQSSEFVADSVMLFESRNDTFTKVFEVPLFDIARI